jgi:hypothetical protein
MVTISEDYVSFETAKLLKEKGFEGFTMFSYSDRGTTMCGHWENEIDWLPKCTLQMAMKWLREVHNLYIDIRININNSLYSFKIYSVGISGARAFTEYRIKSYEEACEAGIKYCLEHLI